MIKYEYQKGRPLRSREKGKKRKGGFVTKIKVVHILCSMSTLLTVIFASVPYIGRYDDLKCRRRCE